jgi:hypothetical protein
MSTGTTQEGNQKCIQNFNFKRLHPVEYYGTTELFKLGQPHLTTQTLAPDNDSRKHRGSAYKDRMT